MTSVQMLDDLEVTGYVSVDVYRLVLWVQTQMGLVEHTTVYDSDL